MNFEVRQCLLDAANHIEANPSLFEFTCIQIPQRNCHPWNFPQMGCLIGWTAYFAHLYVERADDTAAMKLFGINQHEFFIRLDALAKRARNSENWRHLACHAAGVLRLYADTYYPPRYNLPYRGWNMVFVPMGEPPLWAQMRDRDDAREAYERFRRELDLTPLHPEPLYPVTE